MRWWVGLSSAAPTAVRCVLRIELAESPCCWNPADQRNGGGGRRRRQRRRQRVSGGDSSEPTGRVERRRSESAQQSINCTNRCSDSLLHPLVVALRACRQQLSPAGDRSRGGLAQRSAAPETATGAALPSGRVPEANLNPIRPLVHASAASSVPGGRCDGVSVEWRHLLNLDLSERRPCRSSLAAFNQFPAIHQR